jgi:hypothetical protein
VHGFPRGGMILPASRNRMRILTQGC